jgi:hypothetical protein
MITKQKPEVWSITSEAAFPHNPRGRVPMNCYPIVGLGNKKVIFRRDWWNTGVTGVANKTIEKEFEEAKKRGDVLGFLVSNTFERKQVKSEERLRV